MYIIVLASLNPCERNRFLFDENNLNLRMGVSPALTPDIQLKHIVGGVLPKVHVLIFLLGITFWSSRNKT